MTSPRAEPAAITPRRATGISDGVVVLSVMGVNPAMPHRPLEKAVKHAGLPWVMLRPAFFMQDLESVYRTDIAEHDRIRLPARGGRTSFIDTRAVAEVAASVLVPLAGTATSPTL